MSYDFACGYRRRRSAAERDIDERWHAAIYDGSLQAYLREHSTIYQLEPPKAKPPRRYCRCGMPTYSPRSPYCLECKAGMLVVNNRRWLARKRARGA